jgi:hypothetical protein
MGYNMPVLKIQDKPRRGDRSEAMKQPGFMIYAEEWSTYAEDFSDEELGRMLRALLSYFSTQEQTDFADRGMRQFFRQAAKSIDLDAERYALKCRQNAYNRYKGSCRQQNKTPLDFEQWLTSVDDRQGPSPISIPRQGGRRQNRY